MPPSLPRNPHLTSPMAHILRAMRADAADPDGYDGHLVHEGRRWVVGVESVSGPAAQALLQLCAVRQSDISGGGVTYYELGTEGGLLLDDPAYVPAILAVRQAGARAVVLHPDGRQDLEF